MSGAGVGRAAARGIPRSADTARPLIERRAEFRQTLLGQPEGDTVHRAAMRVRAVLVGRAIRSIEAPQERHAMERWPERLAGRAVRAVEARGKHLLIRFEGGLTLHSHLRMGGMWGVYRHGERWRRSLRRAWLVIHTDEHDVVQFDGPVLELMTDARTRSDPRLARLGPDIVADEFDERAFLARLREDDQTRAIGDALLDQRNLAGIGNIWKSEGCFAAGIDPWRPTADVTDDEALAIVRATRPPMRESARGARRHGGTLVYDRAGLPCRRCGTVIRGRGQGDDNRTAYWCPSCQS
ncbi:MAG: DNA-formamidopyrimidine glycosylase family protein [Thermoleophilaceae bacterium]